MLASPFRSVVAAPSLAAVFFICCAASAQEPAAAVPSWPGYRGTFGAGVDDSHPLPTTWDVAKGENIQWKTAIPGLSHSSPVLWGDRIYVTTSVRQGQPGEEDPLRVGLYGDIAPVDDDAPHQFRVMCLDRATGAVLWDRLAWEGVPEIKRHTKGSHAACTPATDGQYVAAFFGSEGLFVYDKEGELVWSVDFGTLDAGFFMMPGAQWGFASSPVIFEGRVYVQCDVQGQSFLAALDVATGEEIWRTDREEVPTWGTPTVVLSEGRRQIVCNGWKRMGGYDLDTGDPLWWLSDGGDIPVPTPIAGEGLVFLTSAHGRNSPVLAISLAAEGELSIDPDKSDHVAWGIRRGGNYMQTPILYGGRLYCCKDMGVVTCFRAATGEELYKQRLTAGVGYTASPVAGDGKLYFTSEEGEVHIVKAGDEFELLGVVPMGEVCMATPAIAEGTLFVRTRHELVAIRTSDG